MKKIPNISFQSTEDKRNFELIHLSSLFEKLHTFDDHNPTLPHRIKFFAILIVTQGTGKHQIDLKEFELKEGTALKIAKGQVHAFQKEPKYDGYLVVFTENFVMNHFSKSSINLISHLYNYHLTSPISAEDSINKNFIDQITSEVNLANTYAQNDILASLVVLYLLKLERASLHDKTNIEKSSKYQTFIQFKNLVESTFTKTRNVKDYADLMAISNKQLNEVVKEFTLNTAKIFIDDYVVLEVKRDIISTQKSLKEIAYDMGFDEVTNFTKFFKKKTNTTPKEFRLQQNE